MSEALGRFITNPAEAMREIRKPGPVFGRVVGLYGPTEMQLVKSALLVEISDRREAFFANHCLIVWPDGYRAIDGVELNDA